MTQDATPVDDAAAALAAAIGARLRQERTARGWTLDQLAAAAGVSRRMVVNVEQGATNPSVGTLLKLSDALGIAVSTLIAQAEPKQLQVVRHGAGATLWSSPGGGRAVLVAWTATPDAVELWEWALMPDDRYAPEPHVPGTQELVQVHTGALTITVGTQTVTLAAGDAVAFPGDVAHAYANEGAQPTTFTMAVFEPGVGRRTRG